MELHKAKILLEKVFALYKSMSTDPANVSGIEKDLMRSYLRQLYEVFMDSPIATAPKTEKPPAEIIKPAPKLTFSQPEPALYKPAPTPLTPLKPEPPAPKEPKVEILPEVEVEEEPPPPPSPVRRQHTAAPPPPPEHTAFIPPTPPAERLKPSPPTTVLDEEMEDLFAFASAKELSEKLADSPIADIKKAMGLNERIFTVNELFGGEQAAFDHALAALQQFSSYDQAKQYLAQNVAAKYNWTSRDKKAKAKNFIKLVKRKFH